MTHTHRREGMTLTHEHEHGDVPHGYFQHPEDSGNDVMSDETHNGEPVLDLSPAALFFYEHAGYGYDPSTETPLEGRIRGAVKLAEAEERAKAAGAVFDWTVDPDIDSSDHDDEAEPHELYVCDMLSADGDHLESLGGVDFGPDGDPDSDPYARVVQAELAIDHEWPDPTPPLNLAGLDLDRRQRDVLADALYLRRDVAIENNDEDITGAIEGLLILLGLPVEG